MSQDVDEIGRRIERLTLAPDDIRAPLLRLVRPVLARFGYRPRVTATKVEALLAQLRDRPTRLDGTPDPAETKLLEQAERELEESLVSVERATVVGGQVLVSHAAWLRRLYEVLVRARRAVEQPEDLAAAAMAVSARRLVLPPLAVAEADPAADAKVAAPEPDPDATRLLELELAAVDHVLAAADGEIELLGRRRRLFEAARQVLLDTNAAAPLEASGVETRRAYIAGEITRLDRLEAAGVKPEVTLSHQLREAVDRGERERVHAALVAKNGIALAAGDAAMFEASKRALGVLWEGKDPRDPEARRASMRRSAAQVFGSAFPEAIRRTYEEARARYRTVAKAHPDASLPKLADDYFADERVDAALAAVLATDGSFEVGGALLPMRVVEYEERYRAVRFPTQDLLLVAAEDPADIPDAIVEDPRTIVMDLAAGRLLARRFVHQERRARARTVMRAEVRVYLLDGSGSMHGARSRMRDAMMAAELVTLKRRLQEGAKMARVVLFYRYFDSVLHPVVRVDSAASADEAMVDVLGTLREGGTDIQAALLASLTQVEAAQTDDPELAQAQIVLVTDGRAAVDEAAVARARARLGDLAVGLSVVALGEENEALKKMVSRQRARGERAFYHFVPDEALRGIAEGTIDEGLPVHLPEVKGEHTRSEMSADLTRLVEEVASLGRAREIEALEALESDAQGRAEAGVTAGNLTEGERARARALYRDRAQLGLQFRRWFPLPPAGAVAPPPSPDVPTADVDAALVVLATVAEVVHVTLGSELTRQADAIDVLERLLPDAQLTPARYLAVVAQPTSAVGTALQAVHRAATPPTG